MYQYEKLGLFGSGQGLLESPCGCSVEFPGSISHGVSQLTLELVEEMNEEAMIFDGDDDVRLFNCASGPPVCDNIVTT